MVRPKQPHELATNIADLTKERRKSVQEAIKNRYNHIKNDPNFENTRLLEVIERAHNRAY